MEKIKGYNGLYFTVTEESTGFHITILNDNNEEIDGFVDAFTNLEDAETACKIVAGLHKKEMSK